MTQYYLLLANLNQTSQEVTKFVGVLPLILRSMMCLGCLLLDFRLLSMELWKMRSDVTADAAMIT